LTRIENIKEENGESKLKCSKGYRLGIKRLKREYRKF
jgi:hypothetical protein